MPVNSFTRRALIMSALATTGAATSNTAVALLNFGPRISNLSSGCQSIYTKPIQGCQPADFQGEDGCSSQCVNALVPITKEVTRLCSNDDVSETSIIGVFLLGFGIQSVCPGVAVTTIASSAAPTPTPQPPRSSAPPSQAQSSPASSAAPESSSTSGILVDPSVPTENPTLATSIISTPTQPVVPAPPPVNTEAPASSAAPPSPSANSQKSNEESGGGSPFDVVATGSSSRPRYRAISALGWILATSTLFSLLS